jgi:hypothetical protein
MLIRGNSSQTSPQQTHSYSSTASVVNDDLEFVDRKISLATEGLRSYVQNWLITRISKRNAITISEYIISLRREINPSQNYQAMQIQALVELSEYSEQKLFKHMRSEDVLSFLDKFRKSEDKDPLHKWIGTYNLKHEILRQFFTWLNDPNTNRNNRLKPRIMVNISQLKRKEVSIYKPSDLWTQEDDLLFLKYCPNKRDRCYHMLSRDSSCRPHELLKLTINSISFKASGAGYQYAER